MKFNRCPFCGLKCIEVIQDEDEYFCECQRCLAQGPGADNALDATLRWNMRTEKRVTESSVHHILSLRGSEFKKLEDHNERLIKELSRVWREVTWLREKFRKTKDRSPVDDAMIDGEDVEPSTQIASIARAGASVT